MNLVINALIVRDELADVKRKLKAMNETIKTVNERRAARKFKQIDINNSLVNQLLDAARMAPSAMNGQPWKFYIVDEKELIDMLDQKIKAIATKMFKMAHGTGFFGVPNPIFHGAPLVIFITANRQNEWASPDIGMCAQNLMLATGLLSY